MTRYAKKPDTNHGEIRDALRAIPGMRVLDTAAMSGLGCDLMARFQDGPPRRCCPRRAWRRTTRRPFHRAAASTMTRAWRERPSHATPTAGRQ